MLFKDIGFTFNKEAGSVDFTFTQSDGTAGAASLEIPASSCSIHLLNGLIEIDESDAEYIELLNLYIDSFDDRELAYASACVGARVTELVRVGIYDAAKIGQGEYVAVKLGSRKRDGCLGLSFELIDDEETAKDVVLTAQLREIVENLIKTDDQYMFSRVLDCENELKQIKAAYGNLPSELADLYYNYVIVSMREASDVDSAHEFFASTASYINENLADLLLV